MPILYCRWDITFKLHFNGNRHEVTTNDVLECMISIVRQCKITRQEKRPEAEIRIFWSKILTASGHPDTEDPKLSGYQAPSATSGISRHCRGSFQTSSNRHVYHYTKPVSSKTQIIGFHRSIHSTTRSRFGSSLKSNPRTNPPSLLPLIQHLHSVLGYSCPKEAIQ